MTSRRYTFPADLFQGDAEYYEVGSEMRGAIWGMFSRLRDQGYNTPAEIRDVFEALFADACVCHGWSLNADGRWWRPA